MMPTFQATPARVTCVTRSQRPAPMFCAAIALTATPSATAGSSTMLSSRCAAPNPATTGPPNEFTSDRITAVPA